MMKQASYIPNSLVYHPSTVMGLQKVGRWDKKKKKVSLNLKNNFSPESQILFHFH